MSIEKFTYEKKGENMNRFKIAQNVAVIGLVLFWGSFILKSIFPAAYFLLPVLVYGWLLGIVAIFVGGLGAACRMAKKIAIWGWVVVPFPMDIFTGLFSFFMAFWVLILFSIIPIHKAYKESIGMA